jgi:hypothetical protein
LPRRGFNALVPGTVDLPVGRSNRARQPVEAPDWRFAERALARTDQLAGGGGTWFNSGRGGQRPRCELKVNIPARIYRTYGRHLVIARPGGNQTTASVFFSNDRLYQLEGTTMAGGSDSDLIRFQQSLTFDRNVANRTPAQMQAFRAACAGNANPAGLDDPRCVRQ